MNRPLDFKGLGDALLQRAGEFLPGWLPGGRLIGREYTCGSLRGGRGDSMKVNVQTGQWAEFAGDEKGGDLISLYAKVENLPMGEAAKKLAAEIGFQLQPEREQAPKKNGTVEHVIAAPPAGVIVPRMEHPRHGAPSASWCYRDEQGEPIFYVARYDTPAGKEFSPWSWSQTAGRWVQKGFPAPRPLYGLDLLAKEPEKPVMIVEGEKAAEAARILAGVSYVAVTWPNGSKAVDKTSWAPLAGRKVLIWPDRDQPGYDAAKRITDALLPICPEVKLLAPALGDEITIDDGWDAADALAEGWDFRKLVAWAKPRAKVVDAAPASNSGPTVQATAAAAVSVAVNVNTAEDLGPEDASTYAIYDQLGLALNGQGQPVCNVDNALRVIERHPKLAELIWFDSFHQRYFTRLNTDGGRQREWEDIDTLNLTKFMQRDLGMRRISDEMVHKATLVYAHERTRNEPRDWLAGLKWDGAPRVETFFIDCFGARDNEYARAVSKNFWVGMVARIFRPGCQLDNMVVLEGGQGIGKTRALRLIGGPWYTEANEPVTSKDFFMILHGKMIVEIAELDAFNKADVTRIKQIVSCTTDRYRNPYARVAKDNPRQSIFVGTTNEQTYLRDQTGARRFWPLACGEIRHDVIAFTREQLFAEAVNLLNAGATWYEMPKGTTEDEQESRRQSDEWEGIIGGFLSLKTSTTVAEVATDPLKIEVGRLDKATQMRVAQILRKLGWVKGKEWNDGAPRNIWTKEELPFEPGPEG